jgi:hypothetical protein
MKAKEAIAKIEEIMTLVYDGYGDFMHPIERLRMINSVIHRYKESLFKKESQEADWEDRSAIQGTDPRLAKTIKARKRTQDADS